MIFKIFPHSVHVVWW